MTRTTAEIRRDGNGLRHERSLYLTQHAYNPLDWQPWGEATLRRARDEDKPIFLSIGYSSCHWCHVMEHESFENDEIAAVMNEHFVCVKVDREERPDLDKAYMDAVQVMTGRGGWPMSVFLTPALKPFYGGTYFPAATFLKLVSRIAVLWRDDRETIETQAEQFRAGLSEGLSQLSPSAVTQEMVVRQAHEALRRVDEEWGGFDSEMKFPTPLRWRFLLHVYRRTRDARLERALRLTLENIARGGIRDHVGGGFHRYTVDPIWLVPHFEKMLYDNAQLASLYVEAAAVFDDPFYAAVARDTLDFLLGAMRGDEGEIFASFDADSGGDEGSYYIFDEAELRAAVGDERDARALALLLGVTARGNFEHTGKSVLTRRVAVREVAQIVGRDEGEVAGLFQKHRAALVAYRARRVAPTLDRKVVTSWNALAMTAFAEAAIAFDEPRYREAAVAVARFLKARHVGEGGVLLRASTAGVAAGEAVLDDYAFLANGLVTLTCATADAAHLAWAMELIETIEARFARGEGGYFMTCDDVLAPLGRQVEIFDAVEPSGASMVVHALLRAGALSGKLAWFERARETIEHYGKWLAKAGLEMGHWLDAALMATSPLLEVVVAGEGDDARTRDLLSVARKAASPAVLVVHVEGAGASEAMLRVMPTLEGKTARDGVATAYVCEFGRCDAPTSDATVLARQLFI